MEEKAGGMGQPAPVDLRRLTQRSTPHAPSEDNVSGANSELDAAALS